MGGVNGYAQPPPPDYQEEYYQQIEEAERAADGIEPTDTDFVE